jgi:hypothetical protein
MTKDEDKKKDNSNGQEKEATKKDEEDEKENAAPPLPPLEAAGRRLERLLGGGVTDKNRMLHTYSNPGKVVRRWLGTASGAAGGATMEDISAAALKLLDPEGPCSTGLTLLGGETVAVSMEVEEETSGIEVSQSKTAELGFLSSSANREVESWLISLMVRLLWKDNKAAEAFSLAQKGIEILMGHLNASAHRITAVSSVSATSLYPLLSRMYRFRSLVAESLNDPSVTASLRQDMARAQNTACLRRDVDCQATLLNLMLQDLLNNSQGELNTTYYGIVASRACSEHFANGSKSTSLCQLENESNQWSKRKNCSPTRPFRMPLRITSFVATSTTAVVFRLFGWSTHRHSQT